MTHAVDTKQVPEAAQEEQSRFFSLSIDMLCIAGFDGYFKLVSPSWESTLGYTQHELLARPFEEFVHPDDLQATDAAYAAQIEEGRDVIQFENRYRCKDGSYRWLLWNSRPDHERGLIYAVARDNTATREAEEELERSNAELEDFTHVVSHDLKEPLRGIEAFSGFLVDECGDQLEGTAREYLDIIQGSVVRMRDLIDDLLELSRIGRTRPRRSRVDVGEVLADLRKTLRFRLEEKGVELRVQEGMPAIVADAGRLTRVFENLIGNAIKYNDRKQGAWVQVSAEDRGDKVVFCVSDNGNGIDPEYADKIFRIFQRLVHREEYEGTGVGLTICKKIIETRGGRIWVESEGEGKGSAFFFSIPAKLPAGSTREAADE